MRPLIPFILLAGGCSPTLELTAPPDASAGDARADAPDGGMDGGPSDWSPPDGWILPDAQHLADLAAPVDHGRPADAALDAHLPDAALPPDAGVMSPLEEGPATPGEHQGTVWAAEGLTLAPGVDAGEFVSAPRPTPPDQGWARLRWAPAVPYGHALANAGAPLVDFPDGQVSQAGLRLLLHLDDPDVWDAGPLDLPVQVVGGHEVAGLFRDAWHLPGTDRITVPAEAVRFGAQDFTWATFAKITPCAGRNGVLLGGEGVARLPAHAWLGCQADDPCPGPGLGGTFRPRLGSSADECAGALPDDDRWHHLAVIKQANRLRFFMDGALAHEASPDLSGDFNLDGFFQIGAFDGGYPLTASVEELAIWARALSPGEIAALSARGLGRAELWARGCPSTDDCGDQPFARLAEQPGGPGFWMDALPRLYPAVQFKVVLRRESGPPPVVRRIILEAD